METTQLKLLARRAFLHHCENKFLGWFKENAPTGFNNFICGNILPACPFFNFFMKHWKCSLYKGLSFVCQLFKIWISTNVSCHLHSNNYFKTTLVLALTLWDNKVFWTTMPLIPINLVICSVTLNGRKVLLSPFNNSPSCWGVSNGLLLTCM